MNATVVILFAMEFVSLMLAVILLTAWKSFGSPRHALTWCLAFIMAAVDWAVHILLLSRDSDDAATSFALHLLSMATWAVMLVGFRQRAGLATPRSSAALIAALSALALALAEWSGRRAPIDAVTLLFSAAMIGLATHAMKFRLGSAAERTVTIILMTFSVLHLVAGVLALAEGGLAAGQRSMLAHVMTLLTLPLAFTGVGLFSVFLLAVDLADRMRQLAASDPLTRVLNRRGFEEAAMRAITKARRLGTPVAVVIADLDRFKLINDRHGHAVGDRVLCMFADYVTRSLRPGDLIGRLGGEEFALLLIGPAQAAAVEMVEGLRRGVAGLIVSAATGPVGITCCFGVTSPAGPNESLQEMIARADSALYRSKMEGRDRVSAAALPAAASAPAIRAAVEAPVPELKRARIRLFSGTAAR